MKHSPLESGVRTFMVGMVYGMIVCMAVGMLVGIVVLMVCMILVGGKQMHIAVSEPASCLLRCLLAAGLPSFENP